MATRTLAPLSAIDDSCPLRHRRASPYIDHMRHSRESMPSFPRRREPRIPALVWVYGRHPCPLCGCRGGSRTARRSRHPKRIPQPNDNCPLRRRRASPYIGCMRHSHAERPSFPRRREKSPLPLGEGKGEGSDDSEMEQNGTKRNRIKSLPLLRTPEGRSTPGMAPPSACSSGSLVVPAKA